MIENFKTKLRVENKTLKWFVQNYLPERNYPTISSQVNGFSNLQDYTKEAIEKYLTKEK
jgi:hypothetical protein